MTRKFKVILVLKFRDWKIFIKKHLKIRERSTRNKLECIISFRDILKFTMKK